MLVLSTKLPTVTPCRILSTADSSNLTTSPIVNTLSFKYTKSTVFAVRLTIWPIARLSWPFIFSPTIVFVSNPRPETNVSLSKTGVAVFLDSNTAIIFTTSGTFNDISSSSTLIPYALLVLNELLSVETPWVLITSSVWLLR